MGSEVIRLLLVDDDSVDADLIQEHRADGPACIEVRHVRREAEYRNALAAHGPFDIVVADYQLGGWNARVASSINQTMAADAGVIYIIRADTLL